MIEFFFPLDPSLRALLALFVPFVCSLLIGPRLIAMLRALKAGQPIRQSHEGCNAPAHQSKVGTPTMGGVMLIGLVLLANLLFNDLLNLPLQCCLLVTAVTALLGYMDDYAKITRHNTDGVSGWFKIAIQTVAAVACAFYLYVCVPGISCVIIPFWGVVDIGWLYIPLALLVIIGASNAVNLTDGLDGLASGCTLIASLALFGVVGIVCSLDTCEALGFFLVSIASACLGFLWFNCHPARVFMGDTGSLALGGALGAVAVCSASEFILVIIGGIFVLEALSVMIQVFGFKLTRKLYGEGRRFFRMAPIHHHFEKGGWSETQVCVRFWIVAFFLAVLGFFAAIPALSL